MSSPHAHEDLTSREWAITALVFEGRTNPEIAAELKTTEQDVEKQLKEILRKTGCWNRTEVALWYLKLGVGKEKRLADRREAAANAEQDRRQANRRSPPTRSQRAHEIHPINLNE